MIIYLLGVFFCQMSSGREPAIPTNISPSTIEERRTNLRKLSRHLEIIKTGPVPYKNIREFLNVVTKSTSTSDIADAYEYLPRVSIRDREDLAALYSESERGEQNIPELSNDGELLKYHRNAELLALHLENCTDPALHHDVVALIEKEVKQFEHDKFDPSVSPTTRRAVSVGLRQVRMAALIKATGSGRNREARPILWTVIEKNQDQYYGQLAARALGKIGEPEDLDKIIKLVEAKPQLRLPLDSFGATLIPRILNEWARSDLPSATTARLAGSLVGVCTHDNIATFVPLLQHPNNLVVRAATNAVEKNLQSGDTAIIESMFKNSSPIIRGAASTAVDNHAWDNKYIPLLIDMLKHDDYYVNRADAASTLGNHGIRDAVPALQDALNDPVQNVRENAAYALKRISGH